MAWLNATPKPDERSKQADPKFGRKQISRIAELKQKKIPIAMPPNPLPSTMRWFLELGITEAAGMGSSPLSWREIEAWQELTGVSLPPWELRLLRHLSSEYLAESRRAEDASCPPPWRGKVSEEEKQAEIDGLRATLG